MLAVGYALAMQLLGTENSTLDIGGQTVIVSIAASLFMSLGFALIYQLSMRHLIVTSVTGMSGWITFLICSHIGMQDFLCRHACKHDCSRGVRSRGAHP